MCSFFSIGMSLSKLRATSRLREVIDHDFTSNPYLHFSSQVSTIFRMFSTFLENEDTEQRKEEEGFFFHFFAGASKSALIRQP